MDNDSQIAVGLERIRSQLESLGTTMAYIGLLGMIALATTTCSPAHDAKSDLASCTVQSIISQIPRDTSFFSFHVACMEGKGYEYTWENDVCGWQGGSTIAIDGCFESRGPWRSAKRFAAQAWHTAFPGKGK